MNKLKNYYDGLPSHSAPKTEFMKEVSERCNVSINMVRRWINGARPSKQEHRDVLAELSSIPAEELFKH